MRWSDAAQIVSKEETFRALDNPRECSQLFEDFVEEMRREHSETARNRRIRGVEKLRNLFLHELRSRITLETRWKTAFTVIRAHDLFIRDPDMQSLEPLDLLVSFEEHIKFLEHEEHRTKQELREQQRYKEASARSAFKNLLMELQRQDHLVALSSWPDIFPFVKNRPEFQALLPMPGSTPLDLFWDQLDTLQQEYVRLVRPLIDAMSTEVLLVYSNMSSLARIGERKPLPWNWRVLPKNSASLIKSFFLLAGRYFFVNTYLLLVLSTV